MRFLLEEEPISLIKKIELEATKYSGVVSLAQWVPWYDTPDAVTDFLITQIKKWKTNRYSIVPWIPELREKIALKYFQKYQLEVDYKNEVCVTAWAIEAISALLLTLVCEQEDVLLLDPSYASYKWAVQVARWNPKYIPLDGNLDIDVDNMISHINNKTKAIVLSNPNNPTGSIFSLGKLQKILEFIKDKDIFLIVDEVYDEFIFDGNEFVSAIRLFEDYKENLIIVNSWSKTFGMTWWRIGYLIANSKIFSEFLKVHDSLVTCAPVHSQRAALGSFEIYEQRTQKNREQLEEMRDYTVKRLEEMSSYISFQNPWATYFVFPRFRYTDDDYEECMKILDAVKLALVPGSGFWYSGKWHFRICFGRDFEDIKEWLNRLEKYFEWNY